MKLLRAAALAAATLLVSAPRAEAHIVGARLGDFYAGALHPMTDPQDVILWVALGVLAGSLGATRGRWLVLTFPLGLVAGLALGMATGITSVGTLGDAVVTALLGLMLAAAAPLPTWGLCAIGAAVALMRGAVNAGGMGHETNVTLFAAGLASAGYAVMTLTMAVSVAFLATTTAQAQGWRPIALRACGSWIAAVGLMMGGFALVT
ncbi:MAG: HupE/UreJ family protein [Rhodospirillales bacterium]